MCKCGCRGWCTLFNILLAWAWDLNNGGLGVHAVLDEYKHELVEPALLENAGKDFWLQKVFLSRLLNCGIWLAPMRSYRK